MICTKADSVDPVETGGIRIAAGTALLTLIKKCRNLTQSLRTIISVKQCRLCCCVPIVAFYLVTFCLPKFHILFE